MHLHLHKIINQLHINHSKYFFQNQVKKQYGKLFGDKKQCFYVALIYFDKLMRFQLFLYLSYLSYTNVLSYYSQFDRCKLRRKFIGFNLEFIIIIILYSIAEKCTT